MRIQISRVSDRRYGKTTNPPVPDAIVSGKEDEGFPWEKTLWEIELTTLEDLLRLVEEHGDIIIHESGKLTVYDDYIE